MYGLISNRGGEYTDSPHKGQCLRAPLLIHGLTVPCTSSEKELIAGCAEPWRSASYGDLFSFVMDAKHKKFCESLGEEELMLITLRDELYEGSWDNMLQDLRDRLKGKPYIFKLVNRIEEDIVRIERVNTYEQENNINLADYIDGREK